MDRRKFLKNTAAIAAAAALPEIAVKAADRNMNPDQAPDAKDSEGSAEGKLITSAPFLQNYAPDSMGIAFAVSDKANGYVMLSESEDMFNAIKVKCGGYRVTDMNPDVMQIRLTGLKPATRYFYKIGADRIRYDGGYGMEVTGNEEDPKTYSFTTAGKEAVGHFCVINDTHAEWNTYDYLMDKIAALAPSTVIWNGDASNSSETIGEVKEIFLNPPIRNKGFASEIPYLFCPGNHDQRGMANRHLEKVWMYRQPEERSSRDWDLGRNFAVRMGDIALIGLDTAEDKVDENPIFAGLFNNAAYREAQVAWLKDALSKKEIASAPFIVTFCHIPLFDTDPTHNPGDIHPADKDPQYSEDYASWQRTCYQLWSPLLEKAKCQLVITAHMHKYRYDAPDENHKWAQIVGGGRKMHGEDLSHSPTVIDGYVTKDERGRKVLKVDVYNMDSGKVVDSFSFKTR